jgi:hypothetical protein
MGKKTSCIGTEVGASIVVAIEVDMNEVDLVELDQRKLVLFEVDRIEDPFEDGPVEENLVMADLVKLGLGILVENPVAEEALSEKEGFGGLLDELTTPGGGIVIFSLIVARDPGG